MQSLLLVLHLPICLPSVMLCFWLPFKDLSPAIPTQAREVLHTHCEWEGKSRGPEAATVRSTNPQASGSYFSARSGQAASAGEGEVGGRL